MLVQIPRNLKDNSTFILDNLVAFHHSIYVILLGWNVCVEYASFGNGK